MTETTVQEVHDAGQRRALRRLADASKNILRISNRITDHMLDLRESVAAGQHCRDLNHQLPFDLQRELTKRQEMLRLCGELQIASDIIEAASTGRW